MITNKLVKRHPHIFGESGELSKEQVEANWEQIKQKEKGEPQLLMEFLLPCLL